MRWLAIITNYIPRTLLTVAGDLIVRGAAGPERLVAVVADKVLRSNGVATLPAWENNDVIHDVNGVKLKCKVINLGPWNMDADATLDVTHGLTHTNIVHIQGFIFKDDLTLSHPFAQYSQVDLTRTEIGIDWINSTIVRLRRSNLGSLNDPAYNDAVMNRGKMLLMYTV